MIAVMGRRANHGWWLVSLGLVLVGGPVLWAGWVYFLPSGPRNAAMAYGQFVMVLVGAVITVLGLLRGMRPADPRPVDTLVDLLALAIRGQWRKEAIERMLVMPPPIPVGWSLSDLPVTGPMEAAVDSTGKTPAFPPLPGQTRVTEDQLCADGGRDELFAVYAGIASGRMIVVGAPGSGKSGTAVMLLLDALDHRDHVDDKDRTRVPVPVLFTAHSWDPASSSVQDWLVSRLAADYPLFQHRGGQVEAAALVDAGAVALILDGLDEMGVAARAAALRALSDAPFRVVVLTRSQEMLEITSAAWLVGAVGVELHEVGGAQAADYLKQARAEPPPLGWTQLLTHLPDHPDSALTRALSTPLALTLVRDTYRPGDDIRELLDDSRSKTADDIEQQLITRVLPNAYTPRPGKPTPRYSLAQAHQALAFLARQMNQERTRDLAWWRIPRWVPTTPRILVSMVVGGLLGGLLVGLAYGFTAMIFIMPGDTLWMEFRNPSLRGLAFGVGLGLPVGLIYGRSDREPKKIRNWRAISLRSVLRTGLTIGLIAGLVVVLMNGPLFILNGLVAISNAKSRGPIQLISQLMAGLAVGLLLGLNYDLPGKSGKAEGNPQELVKSRRKDRTTGFLTAVMVGLMTGLKAGLVAGLAVGLALGLVAGLAIVVGFGVMPRVAGGFFAGLAVGSAFGESSPQGPFESWRNDRVFGLVTGLGLGLGLGLGFGLGNAILVAFKFGFGAGLVVVVGDVILGAVLGLTFGVASSGRWPTTLAWLQLRMSRRVPAVGLGGLSRWKQLSWRGGRRRLRLGFGSPGYGVVGC
jgi:hypothetical protein